VVASKSKKKLVRELQDLRGVSYQTAYNELLGLPPDVAWRGYIEKVREQQNGTSLEPPLSAGQASPARGGEKDGPREGDARGPRRLPDPGLSPEDQAALLIMNGPSVPRADEHREKYPEHQNLKAISNKSQAIGSFLDWLSEEKSIELAVRHKHTDSCYANLDSVDQAMKLHPRRLCGYTDDELVSTHIPFRKLLAEYFEIDEEKIEREKRAMLSELRGEAAEA